jgi:hypothetical protein
MVWTDEICSFFTVLDSKLKIWNFQNKKGVEYCAYVLNFIGKRRKTQLNTAQEKIILKKKIHLG